MVSPVLDPRLQTWLSTDRGQTLLATEARVIGESLEDCFGWETLQIGVWGETRSLVGHARRGRPFRWPDDVARVPLLLPGRESEVRQGFDVLCERYGLRPTILAEVDDMAMLRLLARDLKAVALVPAVVVRDELRSGRLHEYHVIPDLYEDFYAVTVRRQFQHPLVRELLHRPEAAVLGMS